jgi:hypothetical protein
MRGNIFGVGGDSIEQIAEYNLFHLRWQMAGQMTGIFPRLKRDRLLLVIFTKQPPARDMFSPTGTLYMVADKHFDCIH